MIWTPGQFEILKRMRRDGRTAKEIARALRLSVSQVHAKLHHSGLTSDRQRWILKIKAERANDALRIEKTTSYLRRRTGYEMGYVIGVLCGDGAIWRDKRGGAVLRLRVRDRAFAAKFRACLAAISPPSVRISSARRAFQAPASVIRTPEHTYHMKARRVGFFEVTCSDPGVVAFLEIQRALLLDGKHFDHRTRKGVLEGLFDSEGFVVKTVGHVGLQMTNHVAVRWISKELARMGIEHRVYVSPTGYFSKTVIYRKSAIKRFCSLIRFSVPHREALRRKFSRNSA